MVSNSSNTTTEEKRKLQVLGGSLYLSLPSAWLNKFHLRKGSEVIISMKESGELNLFPQPETKEKEKISIISFDQYLFRNLIKNYLLGMDIIKIKNNQPYSKSQREKVFSCVNNILNLEIIEEEANTITIQNLKSDLPIKKMISRMYFLTKSMMEDLCKGHTHKETLMNIVERDKLVGKFYLAIIMQQRALLTQKWSLELSFVEILDLRLLIERMELIGDEVKHLALGFLSKKTRIKMEDLQFLVRKYEEAYQAYLEQDTKTAQKFWDTEAADKKRISYDESLSRIYDLIKDITDLVI